MADMMLRYRTASFFGKIYAPELLMGIPATEEAEDIVTVQSIEPDSTGTYAPVETPAEATLDTLRKSKTAKKESIDQSTGEVVDAEIEDAEVKPGAAQQGGPAQNDEQDQGDGGGDDGLFGPVD
jgi:hypothetical protein